MRRSRAPSQLQRVQQDHASLGSRLAISSATASAAFGGVSRETLREASPAGCPGDTDSSIDHRRVLQDSRCINSAGSRVELTVSVTPQTKRRRVESLASVPVKSAIASSGHGIRSWSKAARHQSVLAHPQPSAGQCNEAQYFKVLYTKRAPNKKKKNKTYQDGVLVISSSGTGTLLDDRGEEIAKKGRWQAPSSLESGSEGEIGAFEYEVDEALYAEDLKSGCCFVGPAVSTNLMEHCASGGRTRAAATPAFQTSFTRAAKLNGVYGARRRAASDDIASHPNGVVLNEIQLKHCRSARPVTIDNFLARQLRPHQQEGVQFMWDCVMGNKQSGNHGCILADEMGLGKTLQVISLIWTLLNRRPEETPPVRRVCIVTPSSLVENWQVEIKKWLGDARLKPMVVLAGIDAKQQAKDFTLGRVTKVLITSYETVRKLSGLLSGVCDLLVCDEGHRLKSAAGNKTIDALVELGVQRRILLTGTPIQNALDEFYAMMSFVNPELLGPISEFKRDFGGPIQRSRDRNASDEEKKLGMESTERLSELMAPYLLRRSATLNQKYLPSLSTYVVFCRPTEVQVTVYSAILNSPPVAQVLSSSSEGAMALSAITRLQKLCNHPDLIYNDKKGEAYSHSESFTSDYKVGVPENSGKMLALRELLVVVCKTLHERVVVVSNSTQALTLVGSMCGAIGLSSVRIDGDTDISSRQQIVSSFNKAGVGQVCLLSKKAGGAGLNLIGASRLVLFDSDWNPALDRQAMARIWRDGQTRPCVVYRLLTTGTIDEKIYQRQLQKNEYADMVNGSGASNSGARHFTTEELKQIFQLDTATRCETAEILVAKHTDSLLLRHWTDVSHNVNDEPLQRLAAMGTASFIVCDSVHGLKSTSSAPAPLPEAEHTLHDTTGANTSPDQLSNHSRADPEHVSSAQSTLPNPKESAGQTQTSYAQQNPAVHSDNGLAELEVSDNDW